ncbi:MAG: hypothetical protein WD021_08430 [Rhodothermales bacterium]
MSKDKWLNHAKNKLSRGYVLIIGTERKTANFHSNEKGYEMCSYQVARQLVKEGAVRKIREHYLGEVYELVPSLQPETGPKVRPARDPEEDFEALLSELDETAEEAEDGDLAD